VDIEFDGNIPELESIDSRVLISRVGNKITRAGNSICVTFPVECLPEVSRVEGVSEIHGEIRQGVPRPIKIQIKDRVKTQKVK
jgi:hypothetical protein